MVTVGVSHMTDETERDTEWRSRGGAAAPPQQTAPARPAETRSSVDGLAITGLVLGCVSVLLCWIPFFGALVSLLAIIFGGIGVGRKISTGMGVAGLVLGILTLIANIVITIIALDARGTW